jgi:hypothetical protein
MTGKDIEDLFDKLDEGEVNERFPISEEEWEDAILLNISLYRQQIRQAQSNLQNMIDLYQTYLYEKDKYKLEFFQEDDTVVYKKHSREPIGFKSRNKK